MRRPRTSLGYVGLTLSYAAACAHPTSNGEALGSSSDAVVSSEFGIACEAGSEPGIAVNGGTALAAWLSSGTVHAARFDPNGNVLDAAPIAMGVPPPTGVVYNPQVPFTGSRLLVVPTLTGFAVVGSFQENDGVAGDIQTNIEYRTVSNSGAITGPWVLLHSRYGTQMVNGWEALGAVQELDA